MTTPSHDQAPPAFRLPDDAGALNAWLEWLDANRLAPAAARIIEASAPDDARARLDAAYAQSQALWLLRKTALQRFLALMAREPALPVILLKGAALALTLHDDPAVRPMNDIDLLVGPEHLARVAARMREAGYLESSLGQGEDVGYLHHFIFTDPQTDVRFEIHRTLPLFPSAEDALSWFLSQTRIDEFAGYSFLTFKPEAQLLHLAAHAVLEHGGARGAIALWFYDIDQLIRRWGDALDWDETLDRARRLAWEAALHEAILLARRYFDTPTPPPIRTWLELSPDGLSGYNILRSMTSGERSSTLIILHILRGLTWRERIQQLSHMLFPSRSYMQRRYPQWPWLLAYPYRWFDAARKLLPALLRK